MLAKEIDIVLGATRVDSQKRINFHRLVILSMKLALQCLNVVNFFFVLVSCISPQLNAPAACSSLRRRTVAYVPREHITTNKDSCNAT